tara:strand:+ start:7983 stop:8288 length:306 start_codon:yes stop_codon:yes gene_type:complete
MSRLKDTENLVKLEFPAFRYYYFKREETIGDKKWSHFEQKAWKQQVAYFKDPSIQSDNLEDTYIWEDIPNAYFSEDIEGNIKQVSLEEFNKGLKYPVKSRT